jgi:hypothetical protein
MDNLVFVAVFVPVIVLAAFMGWKVTVAGRKDN